LTFTRPRWQWITFTTILFGYWLAWALYPAPGPNFDWAAVGAGPDFRSHIFSGFAAHWNKNSNFGQAFDLWFLNLFPRPSRFLYNEGGYLTLSFIPTLGTMILGLIAGEILRSERPAAARVRWFVVAGLAGLVLGWLLGAVGICPVVKRIWTPSWVLFSGGWCFLGLAAFYALIDLYGWRRWAFPLVVIGMNSIAAYVIDHQFPPFLRDSLRIHLGPRAFEVFGADYAPFVLGTAVVVLMWLILYWMWRKKIFLRI
jgi:predicted acyltransferase